MDQSGEQQAREAHGVERDEDSLSGGPSQLATPAATGAPQVSDNA
jgi:hypothetical protein